MRRLVTTLLLLLSLAGPAAAQTPLAAALAKQLDSFPASTALFVKHLRTGEEAAIRADDSFNSQSVIKLAVMVRAFQLADAGQLNLDERVTLTRAHLRDGSGLLQHFDLGSSLTLRDFIQQMIVTSDNTATDLITVKVGGKEAINAWLAGAGYKMRYLNRGWEYRRKLLARLDPQFAAIGAEEVTGLQYAMQTADPGVPAGVFEHFRTLFTGPRAAWVDIVRDPQNRSRHRANQRKLMVEDRDIWLGDVTAREVARLLEGIERCTLTSAASCAAMKLFLRRQLAGATRLPHFVDVPVAHKTGDAANIANDVGIIYSRSGPIVVAALVAGVTGPLGETEDRIGHLAKTIVDRFDGGGQAPAAAPALSRRAIQPPGYKPTPSPLTPGIMVGDTLYLSGSTGGDPATGQLVKGGFEAEMRQIMSNMQTVLKEAGLTLADVVSVTGYLVDMADFRRYNEIYVEYFSTLPLPVRSTVAVKELARSARIEMTMTAVRPR